MLKIPVGEGDRVPALWRPNTNAVFAILHRHGNAEDLGFLRNHLE